MDGFRKIAEGAEASVYAGRLLGRAVILKDRARKRYRIREIDGALRRQRTRSEARILHMASSHGIRVPRVVLVEGTRLYMEMVDGTALRDIVNGEKSNGPVRTYSTMRSSGELAARLHGIGVSHGDLTPANMMVDRRGELWLIDFGLAETSCSPEGMALDILLMKRAVPKELYSAFLSGYRRHSASHSAVLERLAEIERRGRYQTRTLMAD